MQDSISYHNPVVVMSCLAGPPGKFSTPTPSKKLCLGVTLKLSEPRTLGEPGGLGAILTSSTGEQWSTASTAGDIAGKKQKRIFRPLVLVDGIKLTVLNEAYDQSIHFMAGLHTLHLFGETAGDRPFSRGQLAFNFTDGFMLHYFGPPSIPGEPAEPAKPPQTGRRPERAGREKPAGGRAERQ
jgi:hypothetical protein